MRILKSLIEISALFICSFLLFVAQVDNPAAVLIIMTVAVGAFVSFLAESKV